MKHGWIYKGIKIGLIILCMYYVTLGSGKYGEPKLELSVQNIDLAAKEILVRLVVTNVGKFRLCLPHLREGIVENHTEWAGWIPFIKEQHHAGIFVGPWQRASHLTFTDLISLAPGEQFAVIMNFAEMEQFPPDYSPPPMITDTGGKYEASIRLGLGSDSTGENNIPFYLLWKVWEGGVESNTISFVIEEPQVEQSSQEDAEEVLQNEDEQQQNYE